MTSMSYIECVDIIDKETLIIFTGTFEWPSGDYRVITALPRVKILQRRVS